MDAEEKEFQNNWAALVDKLSDLFGGGLDYDGIIFLIGIQELGKGKIKLPKHQKLEIMHIAVCKLLSKYNYYTYMGDDEEGWPHYEPTEELPHLKPMQQHRLIKEAIMDYFKEDQDQG